MGACTFCQKYIAGCACKPGTRPCQNEDSAAHQQAIAGIRGYREKVAPMVPPVWRALEDAALRTVVDGTPHEAYGIRYELEDGWLTARLLDGKKIYYWNPQAGRAARRLVEGLLDLPDREERPASHGLRLWWTSDRERGNGTRATVACARHVPTARMKIFR